VGTKCNVFCPKFRCLKKALKIRYSGGKPLAWCMWVNDPCKGYKCTYALCISHAMLPDGTCTLLSPRSNIKRKSLEEEMLEEERKFASIERKLRKVGRRDLIDIS